MQRGNNRRDCFASDSDFKAYANWLSEAGSEFGVDIHAWVFMTNHVHLLLTPVANDSISRCMQYLGRHYVRYFNHRYGRTGTLFEGRFKSSVVQTTGYFLACQRYIELNPVRAGMVADPADYSWSSYKAHAFGHRVAMWTPHPEYLALGTARQDRLAAYRQLAAQNPSERSISSIRESLKKGLALGDTGFRARLTGLTGVPQEPLKPGRPAAKG